MDRPSRSWLRRLGRGSLALAIAVVACVAVAEVVVRGVLFRGWFPEVAAAERLRNPRRYAHFNADTYQALQQVLGAEGLKREPNVYDRRLGWLTHHITPGTYAHVDGGAPRAPVAPGSRSERRPVLLFGDSFAQGVTAPPAQFQELFERTHLAGELQLVNYGVGGYGFDQICLLAELALPQWVEREPVVLMSLLVDDDIDRCRLSIRSWPKPRYRMVDGEPVLAVSEVPTTAEYMASDPLGWTLWSWQLLVHHEALPRRTAEVLCGDRAGEDEARALGDNSSSKRRIECIFNPDWNLINHRRLHGSWKNNLRTKVR
jgi:hypothetical protein